MISDKGIKIKFLVLVLVFVFVSGDVKVRCKDRERAALLSFKNGLVDEYGLLSSWQTEECCKWNGVVCSNTTAHIISLQLKGLRVHKVGSSLLELHHLTYLDLSFNDFGGVPIPEFIGSMKRLQHLYLHNCSFSGNVPPQLGNLTNLNTLDLSFNYLKYSKNFNWLSTLSKLSYLDLSHVFDLSDDSHATNLLQQIIPRLRALQELFLRSCNMSDVKLVNSSSNSLSVLDLTDNHLTSSAFDWLSNISASLVYIGLSGNDLGELTPHAFKRLNHLENLDLSYSMLEGEIPVSLGNLSHLRVLELRGNDLRGHLDEFFDNASVLSKLRILDLSENQLSGSMPYLTAYSTLIVVDVCYNNLEGTVTESHLRNLGNLKYLDLSFNSLALHIAPDWNPPFQLDAIHLQGCNVGMYFPKWIRTQRNLSVLHLSNAGIVDEFPSWLWNLSHSMDVLDLSMNQISCTIPDLSSFPIRYIDVSSNNISGPMPLFHPYTEIIQFHQNMLFGSISTICQIPHHRLLFLDLSNNKLVGEIPNCWENMPSLSYLILANNSFFGQIPPSLGSLSNLTEMHLHGNNLSGELPSTLKNCTSLELIDVGGNELTGYIPTWIGEMHQSPLEFLGIHYLNLGSNRFYGTIPPQMCNLTHVQILIISSNSLSGKIPDCFNNFTSLAKKNPPFTNKFLPRMQIDVRLTSSILVDWKGHEWNFRRELGLLKLIDFSSNRLTGNIPESFSNMRGLISLNLSRNCLTGHIIPDIGEMEMLECLDLSHNQLSGEIPTSMAELHYLDVLDLSSNNLSGKIPTSTQLQSFDISSYAGNNGLCGPPLEFCVPRDRLRSPTTTEGKKINDERDGLWSLSFMQEVGMSMVFGFIVGFWGVVAPFLLKKSWRYAYFNFLDVAGDWFYVRTAIFLSKFKQR